MTSLLHSPPPPKKLAKLPKKIPKKCLVQHVRGILFLVFVLLPFNPLKCRGICITEVMMKSKIAQE